MFTVILSNIRWSRGRNDLPVQCTFPVTSAEEETWRGILEDTFRGNRFEFQRLLRDVFHVEAERKHDCPIRECQFKIVRPK